MCFCFIHDFLTGAKRFSRSTTILNGKRSACRMCFIVSCHATKLLKRKRVLRCGVVGHIVDNETNMEKVQG